MNGFRQDPTRTTGLRRAFVAAMRRRLIALRAEVWAVVVTADALGLRAPVGFTWNATPNPAEWRFYSDPDKIAAFQRWLTEALEKGLLYVDPDAQEPWLSEFVRSAHKEGSVRGFLDAHPELALNPLYAAGRRDQFLSQAFAQPESMRKVRLLYTRAFEQLKGVTYDMAAQMSGILADGLVAGNSPQEIGRKLAKQIAGITARRAERIARTEIIRAHAEGQLDAFEELGIEKVGALVEFTTAGDAKVCPVCQGLSGSVRTIAEARGVIPVHPECRCAWVPWLEE